MGRLKGHTGTSMTVEYSTVPKKKANDRGSSNGTQISALRKLYDKDPVKCPGPKPWEKGYSDWLRNLSKIQAATHLKSLGHVPMRRPQPKPRASPANAPASIRLPKK